MAIAKVKNQVQWQWQKSKIKNQKINEKAQLSILIYFFGIIIEIAIDFCH